MKALEYEDGESDEQPLELEQPIVEITAEGLFAAFSDSSGKYFEIWVPASEMESVTFK